jgi:putative SOS response-associated peptidase YedK
MGLAGLWEHWTDPDGATVETCAILTAPSNSLIQSIHDRMPVIIPPRDYSLWLDQKITDQGILKPLCKPYPAELMEMYQVSSLVNNPHNDSAECIARLV